MKCFPILLIFLTLAHYGHQQTAHSFDEDDKIETECIKATHVDESLIDKFYDKRFVQDKNLKCFFKCMLVKYGEITESGKILPDVMRSHADAEIPKEVSYKMVDVCKNATGTDPCDVVFHLTKCMVEQEAKLLAKH